MFPASVFRGSSRSRGWFVGVLAHGVDHTTRTRWAAVTSTGAAGHKPRPTRREPTRGIVGSERQRWTRPRNAPREAARWRRRKDTKKSEKKVLPFPTPPQPFRDFPRWARMKPASLRLRFWKHKRYRIARPPPGTMPFQWQEIAILLIGGKNPGERGMLTAVRGPERTGPPSPETVRGDHASSFCWARVRSPPSTSPVLASPRQVESTPKARSWGITLTPPASRAFYWANDPARLLPAATGLWICCANDETWQTQPSP